MSNWEHIYVTVLILHLFFELLATKLLMIQGHLSRTWFKCCIFKTYCLVFCVIRVRHHFLSVNSPWLREVHGWGARAASPHSCCSGVAWICGTCLQHWALLSRKTSRQTNTIIFNDVFGVFFQPWSGLSSHTVVWCTAKFIPEEWKHLNCIHVHHNQDHKPVLTAERLLLSGQFSLKQLLPLQQGAEQFAARTDSTDNILLLLWLNADMEDTNTFRELFQ